MDSHHFRSAMQKLGSDGANRRLNNAFSVESASDMRKITRKLSCESVILITDSNIPESVRTHSGPLQRLEEMSIWCVPGE